jgi:hypothetical protein
MDAARLLRARRWDAAGTGSSEPEQFAKALAPAMRALDPGSEAVVWRTVENAVDMLGNSDEVMHGPDRDSPEAKSFTHMHRPHRDSLPLSHIVDPMHRKARLENLATSALIGRMNQAAKEKFGR